MQPVQAGQTTEKAEEVRKLTEDAMASLATALAEGRSEALTAYLRTLSRFHRYSFGNCLLIAYQRPEATLIAGFSTWKSLGRYVKKGEKGIIILAPMKRRPFAQSEKTEDGEQSPGQSQEAGASEKATPGTQTSRATGSVWGFRPVYVFDIRQTDGRELTAFATVKGNPEDFLPRVRALISEEGIALEYTGDLGGATGVSCGGSIAVLSGLTPAREFSVLVHELAHELLHREEERRKTTTRMVRETEAEAVAFTVCQAIGLDTGTASADYIQLYQGSVETLAASLSLIQETAARILSQIGVTGRSVATEEV